MIRFRRAAHDLEQHTRAGNRKALAAGLILTLLSIAIVYGVHFLSN